MRLRIPDAGVAVFLHLASSCSMGGQVTVLQLATSRASVDGAAIKYLWRLPDGPTIETVWLALADYDALCVSSQAGCALACDFCRTGMGGLSRNLTGSEIVAQVAGALAASGRPRRLEVAFMGMGEPLANLAGVGDAVRDLRARWPEVELCLSTVGIVSALEKLEAAVGALRLQLSVHAADEEKRTRLMPFNRRNPLSEAIRASLAYTRSTGGRLHVNYLLLAGVNDAPEDAARLVEILRAHARPDEVIVKASRFNDVSGRYAPADPRVEAAFLARVRTGGLQAYAFHSRGSEIDAGCGQLAQAADGPHA